MATVEESVDVASPSERAALESLARRLILLASKYGAAIRAAPDPYFDAIKTKGKKLGIAAGAMEELIAEIRKSPAVAFEISYAKGLGDALPPDEELIPELLSESRRLIKGIGRDLHHLSGGYVSMDRKLSSIQ